MRSPSKVSVSQAATPATFRRCISVDMESDDHIKWQLWIWTNLDFHCWLCHNQKDPLAYLYDQIIIFIFFNEELHSLWTIGNKGKAVS